MNNFSHNKSIQVIEAILSTGAGRYEYRKAFLITDKGPEDAPADTGKYRHVMAFSTPSSRPPRTSNALFDMSNYSQFVEDKLRQRGEIIVNRDNLYYLSHAAMTCQNVGKPIVFVPISLRSFELRSDDPRVLDRAKLLLAKSGTKYKVKNYRSDSDYDDDDKDDKDDDNDVRDRLMINSPIYGLMM